MLGRRRERGAVTVRDIASQGFVCGSAVCVCVGRQARQCSYLAFLVLLTSSKICAMVLILSSQKVNTEMPCHVVLVLYVFTVDQQRVVFLPFPGPSCGVVME